MLATDKINYKPRKRRLVGVRVGQVRTAKMMNQRLDKKQHCKIGTFSQEDASPFRRPGPPSPTTTIGSA
uniref:Uncharacterized protein n=1 Tax=Panagrellus redivivus TaxID=6233 RepID=A0A7E4ULB2_PANRE